MKRTRNNFSKATQRAAYERSKINGVATCECHLLARANIPGFSLEGCGRTLSIGNVFYEHIDPDAISKDNSLENCAALVKTCWRQKTDTYDLPVIAKVERVADAAAGVIDPWKQKLPGGRGDWRKKKINGQVVVRATGERA